jgi:uncharacterized protein YhaN
LDIRSFGRLRDRHFDLSPGLNVFYGPNESGKTTVMEFTNSTLVPSGKRSVYPSRSKTDSGSVTFEEDGATRTITLEKGPLAGNVPQCLQGMDPALFRSVFAMNREGLDNMAPITGGDIRARFLTIPGGESIPDALKAIEDSRDGLMGKAVTSPSTLNGLQAEEDRISARMTELRSNAESYSAMSEELERLEASLEEAKGRNREGVENNMLHSKIESQRPAYNRCCELKGRKKALSSRRIVTDEERIRHDELESDLARKRSAFEALDQSRRAAASRLPGGDEARFRSHAPEVESLLYRSRSGQGSALVQPQSVPDHRKVRMVFLAVMAVAMVVSFVVWSEMVLKIVSAASVAVITLAGILLLRDRSPPVSAHAPESSLDSDVSRLASQLGMPPDSTGNTLRRMEDCLTTLRGLDSTREDWSARQMESVRAENALLSFLAGFGGEAGYAQALSDTTELRAVDRELEPLTQRLMKAGIDPDRPLPVVERIQFDTSEQDAISSQIGELKERMNGILDTAELDSLIDRSYTLKAEKEKVLLDGARAIISAAIIQDACTDIYSTVHPEVVVTADRYLAMMTSGSCRINLDPRNDDISVISGGTEKGPKEWSTGLRAQILLSIKLAVAKEMGGGNVPMILDDVLLPFDSDRKEGACRALSEISNEMQVLLFTCDEAVARFSEGLDGTRIIAMKPT